MLIYGLLDRLKSISNDIIKPVCSKNILQPPTLIRSGAILDIPLRAPADVAFSE